jgi:hypothetical protein
MTILHSPGPWAIESSLSGEFRLTRYITDLAAHVVAEVKPVQGDDLVEVANARLIAVAPELLEALEYLLPIADKNAETSFGRDAVRIARVAIAKAKGEPT